MVSGSGDGPAGYGNQGLSEPDTPPGGGGVHPPAAKKADPQPPMGTGQDEA